MDRRGGAHRAAVAPLGDRLDLVGCGIRWVAVAFLGYDSTFGGLECPPLFVLEGPDGGRVRVAMDRWASGRSSYTQGAAVLSKPEAIEQEWLPRFASLGAEYPLRAVLASGTHGDISPGSGGQARGFAGAIARWKARPGAPARLVNATLPQFCRAADEAEARAPFLKALRGCFSHSWDLWPVSLARHAAAMREGERRFLAAEALLAAAALAGAPAGEAARARRERAEWCWAMLADHAWT
ncbi:MAG: hypothetical protein HY721_19935, partial [Planctomycetes bacterium]|nr:hypothetical protein [Planctomycetota bacterium]